MTNPQRTTKKDDYETPQDLFDVLNKVFHFHLDVACDDDNCKCPIGYTEEDNSLDTDWVDWASSCQPCVCWCNPPYSNWAEFAKKACEEREKGATVVMLIPPRTDSKAWHEYIMQADEVIQLKGRVSFVVDGKPMTGNTVGSVVVVFRPRIPGIDYGPPKFLSWDWKENIK